jgi:hypothetical protein
VSLSKAVDKAVAEENARYLRDFDARIAAAAYGTLCRRVFEAQEKGFVQKPYPEETLEEFCARAGT